MRRRLLTLLCAMATMGLVSIPATGATGRHAPPTVRPIIIVPMLQRPLAGSQGFSSPPTTAECLEKYGYACFAPSQVRSAYDMAGLTTQQIEGQGQTIVIVDAFGAPNIATDLGVFDKTYGIPAPPSLQILQPVGHVPAYRSSSAAMSGWAAETTLDVEWSHVIAPDASIDVLETPTNEVEGTSGFPDIVQAEKDAIALHWGSVISQSFGASEASFSSRGAVTALRGAFVAAQAAGITVLAASGDTGAADVGPNGVSFEPHPVVGWPASDPLVTGVGATELEPGSNGTWSSPVAWNDSFDPTITQPSSPDASGGGLSSIFLRPKFQATVKGVTGASRGVPDISMSGSCSGSVLIYESTPGSAGQWYTICGTSESTPLFAGIVALAAQEAGRSLGAINPALYSMLSTQQAGTAEGIVPVTHGSNVVPVPGPNGTTIDIGYQATSGYDLVTGVGTIDADTFVPALAAAATTP